MASTGPGLYLVDNKWQLNINNHPLSKAPDSSHILTLGLFHSFIHSLNRRETLSPLFWDNLWPRKP